MAFRDIIQKNPAVTALVCASIVVVAVVMAVGNARPRGSKPPDQVWFYDLSTGRLFTTDRSAVPPITVDESMAVRARVYGCNGCGEGDRQVVIIEKYPDAAAEKLREPLPVSASSRDIEAYEGRRDRMRDELLLIAAPPQAPGGEIMWAPHTSPQAQTVRERVDDLCSDGAPQFCRP